MQESATAGEVPGRFWAITNLCARGGSIGLPAKVMNCVNIGRMAQQYFRNTFKYIV
jgi:hypothetical protein